MKIAILHGPRDLRLEDHELDPSSLAPDQVWVRTIVTGFKIGTDRGNYEGAEDVPGAPVYPRWVGDSNLGEIRGVGSDVTGFQVGDRVLSQMHHQSEYICTPAEGVLVKVPDGVDPEDAVFGNLYSLSAHCYHKGLFRPGETVAVVGLGTLGLGAVAIGPLYGARTAAIGNSDLRLEMARRMGAHGLFSSDDPDLAAKLDEFSDGRGIDLVILTANPWPAYRTAVEIVRPGGRVSIVSLLGRGEEGPGVQPPLHAALLHQGDLAHRRLRRGSQSLPRSRRRRPADTAPGSPLHSDGRPAAGTQTPRDPPAPLHPDGGGLRDGLPPGQDHDERRVRLAGRAWGVEKEE